MKILIVNGSPRPLGNTSRLVTEAEKISKAYGYECDVVHLRKYKNLKHCVHCDYCTTQNKCIHKDDLGEVLLNIDNYDGIIIASPIYFFTWNSLTKTFIDRLYSVDLQGKILASICVSGSKGYDWGADIILDQFQRISNYCGANFRGMVHKVTNDEILEVTGVDIDNIEELILRLNYLDYETSSSIIRGL